MLTFPFPAGPQGTLPGEYHELRRTGLPEVLLTDGTPVRLAVRYADVAAVLTDDRFSRTLAADLPGVGFGRNQRTGLLDLDPPDHATLRIPVDRAFSADQVEAWAPLLRRIVRDQLRDFAAGPRPADLVEGFTAPLAARTICALTGLGEDAAPDVAARIDEMLATGSTEARSGLDKAVAELVRQRQAEPRDDIASSLLTGQTSDDARTVLFGLLISGYVGNRNGLARHVLALLTADEKVLPSLTAPSERLMRVVEELLRYYPSGNDGLLRVVREPVELSGVRLEPGTIVMPIIAAAARDPEVFDQPDDFNPDRDPNPHLSLGRGTHRCPGDHLVRALFGIVLIELARTLPDLRLAVPDTDVRHTDDLLPMGVESLPVTW